MSCRSLVLPVDAVKPTYAPPLPRALPGWLWLSVRGTESVECDAPSRKTSRRPTAEAPDGGVVYLEGERGAERKVRTEAPDGSALYFAGCKDAERMVRVRAPDGSVLHLDGERGASGGCECSRSCGWRRGWYWRSRERCELHRWSWRWKHE